MSRPRATVGKRHVNIVTEVDVDIDADELIEAGWHSEDDCPNKLRAARAPVADLREVIASLHRQAHPSQAPDPYLCREEPCRSLSFGQLVPAIGRGRG